MLEQSIQTLDAWELRSGAAAPPLLLASVVGGNQLDMRTSSAKMAMEANGEVAGNTIDTPLTSLSTHNMPLQCCVQTIISCVDKLYCVSSPRICD